MMLKSYLPLPAGILDKSAAPFPLSWRRRAVQTTFLLVVAFSVFLLFEYASYLTGGQEDLQDQTDGDAAIDHTLDTAYLPFRPPQQIAVSRKLKPTLPLPASCLDAHIAKGQLCYNTAEPKLDVLWTWVNGTDILLRDAKARIEDGLPSKDPYRPSSSWKQVRQFRDHDELRFSTRSVLAHFRPYTDRMHVLTSDFKIPYNESIPLDYRLGQVPQWLNTDNRVWTDGHVQFNLKHHADIFSPYTDTVFNSYAIESQFGHLTDISENFVYLNDDFFFLNNLTPRTFYTSAYGLVFRMQSDLLVAPTQYRNNVKGEWRSLAASNGLLSDRFGARERPYVTHEAKAASLALLHEISTIWSTQLARTATHPFRETTAGDSDPSMMFMLVHFAIERWREGLLWAWVVGKHGALDDGWTTEIAERAWGELGGMPGDAKVSVHARTRESLNPDRVSTHLRASGHKQVDGTKYEFTSQDGYPYAMFRKGGEHKWPLYRGVEDKKLPQCSIDYDTCFTDGGKALKSASEVFKNIAFRQTQCGDCISIALVAASGELGLEAFLPPPERIVTPGLGKFFASQADNDEVPHLPVTDQWKDGRFALADVVSSSQETNVREWTLRMLQRYRFTIADTPSHFAMLTGPGNFNSMAQHLKKHPNIALLCVNDDIAIDEERTSRLFKAWGQEHWGVPAQWERPSP